MEREREKRWREREKENGERVKEDGERVKEDGERERKLKWVPWSLRGEVPANNTTRTSIV